MPAHQGAGAAHLNAMLRRREAHSRSWRGAAFRLELARMTVRLRKFIGSLALIGFSLAYYGFVISVALVRLPTLATQWHILFYFLSVVVWFVPSALIIRWIQR
jgi:hypothetical protein